MRQLPGLDSWAVQTSRSFSDIETLLMAAWPGVSIVNQEWTEDVYKARHSRLAHGGRVVRKYPEFVSWTAKAGALFCAGTVALDLYAGPMTHAHARDT